MSLVIQNAPPRLVIQVHERPVVVAGVGLRGTNGQDGLRISADSDNRMTTGADSGVFVPEWNGPEPLAYYILAKS